jgi:hypothetical protein
MQNLPSNYEVVDIALGPSQLNRNLLARNEVDFATSETAAGSAVFIDTAFSVVPLLALSHSSVISTINRIYLVHQI